MSGLGAKRPGGNPGKKPVSVGDLFGGGSDSDEETHVQDLTKKQKVTPAASTSAVDPETQKVADKLADFVAKNGRNFEDMTRDRNLGNTPFKFLHDKTSSAYKYYVGKVETLERQYGKVPAAGAPSPASAAPPSVPTSRWSAAPPGAPPAAPPSSTAPSFVGYQTLHSSMPQIPPTRTLNPDSAVAKAAVAAGDSLAAMDAYMRLAAKKEGGSDQRDEDSQRSRGEPHGKETSFDRRKVTSVFKEDGSRGHHMQDFIPPEELAKFLTTCGNKTYEETAKALEDRFSIKGDNIGHQLLQKMGWKEGQGVGASGQGITAPIQAGNMRQDNAGLGAGEATAVSAEDDVFEQYRKRMQLGYKYRPNPLGNPRKAYY